MTFEDVLQTLSRELGTPLDAVDGTCAFAAGDDEKDLITVVLQDLGNGVNFVIWSDIGAPHPDCEDTVYRIALEANDLMGATGGAMLSVIAKTGHFRIQRVETFDTLSTSGRSFVEGFLDAAIKWHQVVTGARTPEEVAEGMPMMDGNFLSV